MREEGAIRLAADRTPYASDGAPGPETYVTAGTARTASTASQQRHPDGSVTLNLAPEGEGLTNHLYLADGWNYVLRLYRPQPTVLDKTWTPSTPQPL